jgi:hypothetical protein
MALRGNLKDVGLNQLLNLINLARKTGALTLQGEGSAGNAHLFFKEGKLIQASMNSQVIRLTDILVKVGKLTPDQAKTVNARSKVNTDKELGLLIIQNGMLSQNDIIQGVKSYLLESVYRLFTWRAGAFRFDANILPPEERITVAVSLDHLILEGSRRVQEWEQLRDELPDLDVPVKLAQRPEANLRDINLSVEQWKVISFVNAHNTIRQIASFLKIDEFQIRRIVYGLQTAGLIEVIRPAAAVSAPALPLAAPTFRPIGRSVLLRVIDRLRKI